MITLRVISGAIDSRLTILRAIQAIPLEVKLYITPELKSIPTLNGLKFGYKLSHVL